MTDRRNVLLLLALGSLAAIAVAAHRTYRHVPAQSRLILAGILYVAVANPANILKTVLSDMDRGPYRPFVDTGFADTVAYLNANHPGESIVAPKDLGYYYDGLHYPIESIEGLYGIDALLDLIRSGGATLVVDSLAYPASPRVRDALPAETRTVRCGDFAIRSLATSAHPRSTAVAFSCRESATGARRATPLRPSTSTGPHPPHEPR